METTVVYIAAIQTVVDFLILKVKLVSGSRPCGELRTVNLRIAVDEQTSRRTHTASGLRLENLLTIASPASPRGEKFDYPENSFSIRR